MSISDCMDEIEARSVAWPWLDRVADDKDSLISALRAVLDLCEKTPLRYQFPLRDEPFMVLGTDVIRSEIAAALGEES